MVSCFESVVFCDKNYFDMINMEKENFVNEFICVC